MSPIFNLYPTCGDHIPGEKCFCHPEITKTALGETILRHQTASNLAAKLDATIARAEAAEARAERLQAELDAANEDAANLASTLVLDQILWGEVEFTALEKHKARVKGSQP